MELPFKIMVTELNGIKRSHPTVVCCDLTGLNDVISVFFLAGNSLRLNLANALRELYLYAFK